MRIASTQQPNTMQKAWVRPGVDSPRILQSAEATVQVARQFPPPTVQPANVAPVPSLDAFKLMLESMMAPMLERISNSEGTGEQLFDSDVEFSDDEELVLVIGNTAEAENIQASRRSRRVIAASVA